MAIYFFFDIGGREATQFYKSGKVIIELHISMCLFFNSKTQNNAVKRDLVQFSSDLKTRSGRKDDLIILATFTY